MSLSAFIVLCLSAFIVLCCHLHFLDVYSYVIVLVAMLKTSHQICPPVC